MTTDCTPRPEHHFTFGLWTVGSVVLPGIGHVLAFVCTLDRPGMIGFNPEMAHDTPAGLDLSHDMAKIG